MENDDPATTLYVSILSPPLLSPLYLLILHSSLFVLPFQNPLSRLFPQTFSLILSYQTILYKI